MSISSHLKNKYRYRPRTSGEIGCVECKHAVVFYGGIKSVSNRRVDKVGCELFCYTSISSMHTCDRAEIGTQRRYVLNERITSERP